MGKILGILIFLLTLLPLVGSGDAFTLKAQNFAFENGAYWLPEVGVEAEHKVKCDCCKQSFDDDDAFDRHLKHAMHVRLFTDIIIVEMMATTMI